MTPALKAMVQAMGAEFERQAAHSAATYAEFDPFGRGEPRFTVGEDGGLFDLEKVARAGLAAVRAPDKLMEEAARAEEGCGCPCCVCSDDWEAMIDAILGEKR